MRAIKSLIWPCTSVIAVTSLPGVRGLGEADMEADVRPPVILEGERTGHPRDQVVQPLEVVIVGALRGEHGGAGLHRDPVVERRPRRFTEWSTARRARSGGSSETKVPPARPRTEIRWPL